MPWETNGANTMRSKSTSILLILMILSGVGLSIATYRSGQQDWGSYSLSFLSRKDIQALPWEQFHGYGWVAALTPATGNDTWFVGLRESGDSEYTDAIRVEANRSGALDVPAVPGTETSVDGTVFMVQEVRPWAGLMAESSGEPGINMAVSLDRGETWVENQMLGAGEWLHLESLGIWFQWHETETEQQRFLYDPDLLTRNRRWGVRDGSRIHWFTSFEPGTGVERDDGALVTLLGVLDGDSIGPALVLEVEENGQTRKFRVHATGTTSSSEQPFFYLDPGAEEEAVVFSGVWEGEADFILFRRGEVARRGRVKAGERIQYPRSDTWIRVDQIVKTSVPVRSGQSGFREALLRSDNRVLRVRQGATVRVGDTELSYIRAMPNFSPLTGIAVRAGSEQGPKPFALAPGEGLELVEDWLWLEARGDELRLNVPAEGLPGQLFWVPAVLAGVCLVLLIRR
jgi:hypothetical protein